MYDLIQRIATLLPALLLSLTVHEYAHAWVATKLGDSTPVRQGRLTLSPLPHIDPIGTIALPILLQLTPGGGFLFGWAKPVQFSPANFTRKVTMWQGTALTAAAGPLSNVVLAALTAVVLRLLYTFVPSPPEALAVFLEMLFQLNVVLAVFNLVPLPPLDGGHFIPRSLDRLKELLVRYSFLLFLLLFLVPIPGLGGTIGGLVIGPLSAALRHVLESLVGLR